MAKKFFGDVELKAGLKLSALTASRAVELDGSGDLVHSAVTGTELGYLSGVTSAIQTQLGAKIPSSEKGANNGVATLDGSGLLPASQLPVSTMEHKGAWDVSGNSPTLIDGTGTNGDFYRISVAGSRDLGSGSITYAVGDAVIYNGTIWQKLPGNDLVISVAGKTGAVTLDSTDATHTQATPANWTVADGATIAGHLDELGSRMVAVEGGSSDDKDVKISSNDTTAGFLEDKVVASDGSNSANILEISTLNDGGDEDLQIQIDQAKIDHDSLLNFAADEHVAHSGVSVVAGGEDGLSASNNDLSSNIGLSVDITGSSAIASLAGSDEVLAYGTSGTTLGKTTVADIRKSSAGDLLETSFAGAESASAANVTGFAFANGTVRSFRALVSVNIDATADLNEQFMIDGIQKAASWEISVQSIGDDASVTFAISAAGQITYSSSTYAGFASMSLNFRADTTSV